MSEHVANGCRCEEPPEPEASKPVNLAGIVAAYGSYTEKDDGHHESAAAHLLASIPALVAELSAARAELDRLHGLPTREEYACAVGGKKHPDDCTQVWHTGDADEALRWADNGTTGRAWTRAIALHPWVELSAEPPF